MVDILRINYMGFHLRASGRHVSDNRLFTVVQVSEVC